MQNPFFQSREAAFFNQRLKFYPTSDGGYKLAEICTFSDSVFNPDSFERADFWGDERKKQPRDTSEKENECSLSALNRAKKAAFDYMACNPECNMFVTLTLDEHKISRTEWGEIVPRLNTWLDNAVRRRGLKYILVPEFHADGKSIHFHGLMNEKALSLVNSGKKHRGKVVYNIQNWKFGFTTAKRIGRGEDEHIKVCKYVFKYMTKAAQELKNGAKKSVKIGGRYYLHGGALASPRFEYRNADYGTEKGVVDFETEISDFLRCCVRTFI